MDFWTIIAIFVGALGAVGIASFFVPSLANFISAAFSNLFSAVRQIIQFMVDVLPKPFKILLFIGLFSTIGVLAYEFTYGAQFVCSGNNILKVGWLEGVAYKFSATHDTVFQENQKANDLLALNTTNPLQATSIVQPNGSDIIQTADSTYKGINYKVTYALMPREEPMSTLGIISFFEANDADIWSNWFGGDRYIEYQLCSDAVTKTCILERYHPTTGLGGCGGSTVFSALDPWQGKQGKLLYYADADNKAVTGSFSASNSILRKIVYGSQSNLNDICTQVSDSQLTNIISDVDGNVLYSAAANAYSTVLQGQTPEIVTFVDKGLFGSTTYTLPIYDVDYVAVFKESLNNTVFSTAVLTQTQNGQAADTRNCDGSANSNCDRSKLLSDAKVANQTSNDFAQVTCNTKTSDPGDTTLTLAGINILDPATMAVIMLIGAAFSALIYLKQLF